MSNPKSVDPSLWWDPFTSILTDLENAPLSSQLPPSIEKKLKRNHAWFVDTVSRFKPPNAESRQALISKQVKVGSHELIIKPELKDKALHISSYLSLDEVQSYILVERSLESHGLAVDSIVEEYLHVVLLEYYIERQCLLKCIRQILLHALYFGISSKGENVIRDEAKKLISDGLERKLISILQDLLSSSPPEEMDVDLFTLWAEGTLIEDNLVLDILFLIYYESFCLCNGETWTKLCSLYKGILSGSYNFGKLAISSEALKSSHQAKVQLLLILMETLDLENLLQLVHDETPFRPGASLFSIADIQQMDVLVSSFNAYETKEAGPLILTWAVCLCLITSLPKKEEHNVLMGPVAGYRSVLRTFVSAFIASYEINLQSDNGTLNLILDILCKIYRGEESLCNQFWDKESFIDGPIRLFLYLANRFNFLDKSVGISSLFEITSESLVDNISQIVETNLLLHVPGVEGLFIPNKTRGHVLKVIGGNTAIVRWEAVTFSLMDLGNSFYFQDAGMNRQMERNSWVVDIICAVIKNLSPTSAGAAVMSMGVSILAKMLKCSPSHVAAAALKSNIFEMTLKTSIGSWMLPGKLAKMLLIDCEQNDFENPLTISVLEFTMRLVETRLDNDLVLALVVFCLQYILINHEQWKYKVKLVRWRVSLKVLELMKTCIMSISFSEKSSAAIRDILLCDSSIHSVIFRLICTTKQSLENLYVSRLVELVDIDGFQCAISSALDILYIMLSKFSEDLSPGLPVFHQAVLSSSTKPIPVVSAVMSLISFTRNPEIQVGAAKVLSSLLNMADYLQPYFSSNMCFGLDDEQIADFRHSVKSTLLEQMDWNEDLFVAIVNLLTAAASHQPPFLVAILAPEAVTEVQSSDTGVLKQSTRETSNGSLQSHKSSLLDALMQNIEKGGDFINSNPRLLVVVLDFLKALWQGAAQYINILESLKSFRLFWKKLSNCISLITSSERPVLENLTEKDAQSLAYKYRCQSVILEIMAYEMFLKKKLLHAESLLKEVPRSKGNTENAVNLEKSKSANDCDLKDIMSSWCDISILGNLIKSYTCEFDNEICYHAKLEGRKMGPGPFKELSLFLVESKCLQIYQQKYSDECLADVKDIYLYDLIRIKTDLGLDMWDYTEWKEYKAIAETMLGCMQQMNSMVILSSSKLSMLKALITVLTMYEGNLLEKKATTGGRISDQLFLSCIDHMCRCFHVTVESLAPVLDASEEILNCVWTQAELLLHLVRLAQGSITLPACALVLKTSGVGLKAMTDFRSSISRVGKTVKILLMLLLFALEFSKIPDKESEGFAEISNVCLGLLPILCECTTDEHCGLSLTTIDLILKSFLTPKTWFPIIQKHLQLLHVILKLHEDNSPASIPIKLKFLLTLARVREGAELLLSAGFLSSLQVLFGNLLDGRPSTMTVSNIGFLKSSEKDDKSQHIWGLGLAVVTAMVHSLKDSSCTHVMENVIPYLFSEKANLISYYLDAPDFPSDNHDKKRSRAQRTQTSLNALKETEHTLLFICTLAKHWNVWVKAMKEMDSQLREKSVHLLAFISRGTHHLGESTSRMSPLLCPPMSKEEFECCNKPSFINSRNGWFALSPICCAPKPKPSAVSATSTALAIKSQSTEITGPVSPSYFSDLVGLQIYRIAFLLLKFLCLEAEGSVKRSEELGFVDLAHIPELPMPEILHGLQDQAITVVSEICNANKLKQVHPEIQDICLMLLQIMEMALYLELCVLQICGIRPVLGRVEDFSKEIKLLLNAMEGHAFLKSSIRSLKQIVSLVYPGLLQTEGLL
ncbi:conserved hypothetical protein [Ricinus communis]|uniref:Nucleoporin n=1 Tax=Ricinus communis TaxID=3988 RepID=B9SQI9_RICCO|nr:conserved hypothetical protein [Ricinus communis]